MFKNVEPGGVADQEQWEIRWAKPIGPIKQAERQRCINEAIGQSKSHKKFDDKRNGKRNSSKMRQPTQMPVIHQDPLNLPFVRTLAEFVSMNYQASCSYVCVPTQNPSGFYHKVIYSIFIKCIVN